MTARTLYDKLWDEHVVCEQPDGSSLIYIDRQLLHEVSSPQGFAGLHLRGRQVRRPKSQLAVADHAVPTHDRDQAIADPLARKQVDLLVRNVTEFAIPYVELGDGRHGIVHVIGPELGFTLPGITLVCGDSHTSTHGAFGALAFGIGASECECVLVTQTLRQRRAKNMSVRIDGVPPVGVAPKDIILALIAKIGASGAVGYAIEYSGEAVRGLSMEGRMTLCNMSIEAGSRTGLVAPDETTFAYVAGRPLAPDGEVLAQAIAHWRTLHTDSDAVFDKLVVLDVAELQPQVTWGVSPDQGTAIDGRTPDPARAATSAERDRIERALDYMGVAPDTALQDIAIDRVFIGSCTNGRIEDLRAAAKVAEGRSVHPKVRAMVVPGSAAVKRQAEQEGLDKIFLAAGFDWREAGCSLCVAMNDDRLAPGERCASTSNRNFEGRQGPGARTHLMSPASAAACAIAGHLADARLYVD